jgi:hypothetical protein
MLQGMKPQGDRTFALHFAAAGGNAEVVDYLLSLEVLVHIPAPNGESSARD